jgi:predicted GIY-YIG superfamily endonuclease
MRPRGHWTVERVHEEALKYRNKTEFAKFAPGAYDIAKKRKWVDHVCSHMENPKRPIVIWTLDRVRSEARKYSIVADFRRGSPSAHARAFVKGWLGDVCAHMPKGKSWKWFPQRVAKEAAKYKTRLGFQQGEVQAYHAARRLGILDEVCSHMGPPNLQAILYRSLYVIRERGARRVYVGLSVDPQKRYASHLHKREGSAALVLARPHRFLVASASLPAVEAGAAEGALMQRFRDAGWDVVNFRKGGGLGGKPVKWTKKSVLAEAKKYRTRTTFMLGSKGAYVASHRFGIHEAACAHMDDVRKPDGYWTRERMVEAAKTCRSRTEFQVKFKTAYEYALADKLLDGIYADAQLERRNRWSPPLE